MAIRKIVRFGDSVLEKECRKVEKFDKKLHQLLDDMKETLADADGAGLAAPQVGILLAVCVVDVGEGPIELVNPEIIATEGEQERRRGLPLLPRGVRPGQAPHEGDGPRPGPRRQLV